MPVIWWHSSTQPLHFCCCRCCCPFVFTFFLFAAGLFGWLLLLLLAQKGKVGSSQCVLVYVFNYLLPFHFLARIWPSQEQQQQQRRLCPITLLHWLPQISNALLFFLFLLLVVCCRVILCWNYEFFAKSADCSEKCKGSAQFSVRFLLGFFVVAAAAAVAVLTKWIIRLSGILHFCWLCLQGSSFLILFLLFLFFYFIGFFSLQSFRLFYNLFSRRRRRLWRQLIIFAFSFL